jgi:hypothetical protein
MKIAKTALILINPVEGKRREDDPASIDIYFKFGS